MTLVPDDGPLSAHQALAAQRQLLIFSPLDDGATSDLCAQLLALDGESGESVELLVKSDGGPLHAIFPLLDVISLMRAPVNITCLGTISGTAIALVLAGTGRREARPRARFRFGLERVAAIDVRIREVTTLAEEEATLRQRYVDFLVERTGEDADWLHAQLDDRTIFAADRAHELGILTTKPS